MTKRVTTAANTHGHPRIAAHLPPQVVKIFSQVVSPMKMPGGQGVAGSNPAVPTVFQRFFAMYSSSTAVPEEDS